MKCDGCGNALSGRQVRWCSEACRERGWHEESRRRTQANRDAVCFRCRRPLSGNRRTWCSAECQQKGNDRSVYAGRTPANGAGKLTCYTCGEPLASHAIADPSCWPGPMGYTQRHGAHYVS